MDDVLWRQQSAARRRAIRRRRLTQLIIVAGVAGLVYVLIYGPSISYALEELFTFGGEPVAGYVPTEWIISSTMWTVGAVVVALGALRIHARWWPGAGMMPWSARRVPAATVCGAIGLVMAACAFGALVIAAAVDGFGLFPGDVDVEVEPAGIWWSAIGAGIGEEILVLAIPVMVLRFYRTPTALAIWILVALRVAYHLYYNVIGVWWVVPWATVAALVYWCWPDPRILLGLIIEHIAYDVLVFADDGWLYWYAVVAAVLLVGATMANPSWYRTAALPMPSVALRPILLGYNTPGSRLGKGA